MDITFTCGNCGQEIVIDEAGAGITIDCPSCGKPVYVPTKAADKSKEAPLRVETPLAKLGREKGKIPPSPPPPKAPPPPNSPRPPNIGFSFSPRKPGDVHPSIQASLVCLIILAVLFFVGIAALEKDFSVTGMIPYVAAPLVATVVLCSSYAICHVGQVKYGVLLIGGLTLLIALFCRFGEQAIWRGIFGQQTQMQQQMQQQLEQFQKQLPQFPRR